MAQEHVEKQESASEGVERTHDRKVFIPQVDIQEVADGILLVADMPGVDDKGVDITIEKNVLTIRGKVEETIPEGFSHVYGEYRVGDFERVFTVPNEVDRENIRATMNHGVLRLHLPKAKQTLARKVSVTAG